VSCGSCYFSRAQQIFFGKMMRDCNQEFALIPFGTFPFSLDGKAFLLDFFLLFDVEVAYFGDCCAKFSFLYNQHL